jgi:biopolymer transport protein ExbD
MTALNSRSIGTGGLSGTAAAQSPARLQLTSLVDMMVILVVFLLKSFAVEGQLATPAAGLELPESSSRVPVPAGLVVEIGPQMVRVGGRDTVPTSALAGTGDNVPQELEQALSALARSAAGAPVLVQADQRLDYRHLSQVLRACAGAGWSDVTLVVLEVES